MLIALDGPDGDALRGRLGRRPDDAELADALGLVRASSGVAGALDRARAFNDEAVAALEALPAGRVRDGLASLPGRLPGLDPHPEGPGPRPHPQPLSGHGGQQRSPPGTPGRRLDPV